MYRQLAPSYAAKNLQTVSHLYFRLHPVGTRGLLGSYTSGVPEASVHECGPLCCSLHVSLGSAHSGCQLCMSSEKGRQPRGFHQANAFNVEAAAGCRQGAAGEEEGRSEAQEEGDSSSC